MVQGKFYKMKILVFPTSLLIKSNKTFLFHLVYFFFRKIIKLIGINLKSKNLFLSGDLNHYGEIIRLVGPKNIFFCPNLSPIYYNKLFKVFSFIQNDNYPSNFDFVKPSFISFKNAEKNINKFDIIISSVRCSKKADKIIQLSKKYKNIHCIFDRFDHEEVYFDVKNIFRGFDETHFDIYFKQDIPIDFNNKKIYPISPLPVKKVYNNINDNKKSYPFSFVGHFKTLHTRDDRLELIELIKSNFPSSKLIYSEDRKHQITDKELKKILFSTKINLSPSGRIWDSYRHTELVNYGSPILMPKNDSKICGTEWKDLYDCIIYETKFSGGKWRIKNTEELIKKLNKVLNDENLQKTIYNNFRKKVIEEHTQIVRSKYMLMVIKTMYKQKFSKDLK